MMAVFENLWAIRTNRSKDESKFIFIQHLFNMPLLHKVIQHHNQLRNMLYWNSLLIVNFYYYLSLSQFFKLHVSSDKWLYSAPIYHLFMQYMFFLLLKFFFILCVFFIYSRVLEPRWGLKILLSLYSQISFIQIVRIKLSLGKLKPEYIFILMIWFVSNSSEKKFPPMFYGPLQLIKSTVIFEMWQCYLNLLEQQCSFSLVNKTHSVVVWLQGQEFSPNTNVLIVYVAQWTNYQRENI